jgi:hypothetical protein
LKYFGAVQLVASDPSGWISAMTEVATLTLLMWGMWRERPQPRKKEDARSDLPVTRSQPSSPEQTYARRRLSYASAGADRPPVSYPVGVGHDRASKPTAEQVADLIERGFPERLARSGNYDYASLTSGSVSDRIRNGCC